jgi:putative peptidoglycan lipid II flippase
LRDVLSARYFGLGEPLALFQLSSFLALFCATTFSGPLFSCLVPILVRRESEENSADRPSQMIVMVAVAYVVIALLVGTVTIVYGATTAVGSVQLVNFTFLALASALVLALSGPLVAANALLGAGGRSAMAMGAQAVVPVVAIAVLMFFHEAGAWALAGGAIAGQSANFYLVMRSLQIRLRDFTRAGRGSKTPFDRLFFVQYGALVVIGMILGANQPLGIWLAERQGVSAVAAFALGSKAVVLLNGLVWIVVAYVVLPYFSRLLKQGVTDLARIQLAKALQFGTVAAIPLALLIAEMAAWVVRLFFERGSFSSADTSVVARVMEFGVLQLPALVVVLILLKFATAEGRAMRVLWVLPISLVFNIWVSTHLMGSMGVGGVALGGALSVGLCALLLLIHGYLDGNLPFRDLLVLAVLFVFYVGLCIALDMGNINNDLFAGVMSCCSILPIGQV